MVVMEKETRSVNHFGDQSLKTWQEIGFSLEKTQDGSPTLRRPTPTRADFETGQSMHHSGGAWDETLYVYKPVTDWVKEQGFPESRFLSVGLGLGYVELLIAREFLNLGKDRKLILQSFEIVPELRDYFKFWIFNQPLHPEVQRTYDQIANFVFSSTEQIQQAKNFLGDLYEKKNWRIDGALEEYLNPQPIFHGLIYDAFSRAVSPALWTPEFLKDFLRKWAAPQSCLGTFSCTGDLKRSLKAESFELQVRLGFQSKRNCTLAYRQSISANP